MWFTILTSKNDLMSRTALAAVEKCKIAWLLTIFLLSSFPKKCALVAHVDYIWLRNVAFLKRLKHYSVHHSNPRLACLNNAVLLYLQVYRAINNFDCDLWQGKDNCNALVNWIIQFFFNSSIHCLDHHIRLSY